MRPIPHLALLLATLVAGGCDAYGGAPDEGGGGGDTAFVVASRHPAPGSSGVAVGTYVEIAFSGLIDTTSVDASSISLATVPGGFEPFGSLTVNGQKLRFTPSSDLAPGTSYSIAISADLRGTNGHLLGQTDTSGFKTAGAAPPPDTLPPLGPRPR